MTLIVKDRVPFATNDFKMKELNGEGADRAGRTALFEHRRGATVRCHPLIASYPAADLLTQREKQRACRWG